MTPHRAIRSSESRDRLEMISNEGLSPGERRKRIGPPAGGPSTFLVGPRGLEPRTSPLSGVRSHHLS